MRLLLDQNVSRRLADSLSDLYPESTHVALCGLEQADDRDVWEYARAEGLMIVSKDTDFHPDTVPPPIQCHSNPPWCPSSNRAGSG